VVSAKFAIFIISSQCGEGWGRVADQKQRNIAEKNLLNSTIKILSLNYKNHLRRVGIVGRVY